MNKETNVDVLLQEYQACHRNRNHYDSIRWSIGSIFIAISSAVFGISLTAEVIDTLNLVITMAFFSLALILAWYFFVQHVNPYVWLSVVRFHEIEQELRNLGYNIRLHKSIYGNKQFVKGKHITFLILLIFTFAWFFRIILKWQNLLVTSLIVVTVFLIVLALLVWGLPQNKWGDKIQAILAEGEKTEIMLIEKRMKRFKEEIEKVCGLEKKEETKEMFAEFHKEIMERVKVFHANS